MKSSLAARRPFGLRLLSIHAETPPGL